MSELFGKIILTRKSELLNRFKGFKVEVNGVAQDKKITNGISEEYEVPSGVNRIVCKINWCSSNTYEVNLNAGEINYLKVGSGMKYYWIIYSIFLLGLFAVNFFREYFSKELKLVILVPTVLCFLYVLYYLTIGRKKYLLIEKDTDNIFAK